MNKSLNIAKVVKLPDRPVIVIDVDGTMYDSFKEDDRKNISKIFGKNVLVKLADKILWAINSLDLISNSMWILKLRLFLYAIMSFKSYSKIYTLYKEGYMASLDKRISYNINLDAFSKIRDKYEIVVVTNNIFSMETISRYFDKVIFCPNSLARKKELLKYSKCKRVELLVGNNFMDDVLLSRKLSAGSLYVGSSKLKGYFKASLYATDFASAIAIISNLNSL